MIHICELPNFSYNFTSTVIAREVGKIFHFALGKFYPINFDIRDFYLAIEIFSELESTICVGAADIPVKLV